jgi:protein tyrosine phosphatase (PTP) superfamily phosphohydrolase (DUF442 family)
MFTFLLVPAIILAAPSHGIPNAMEVRSGTFVLNGPMTPAVIVAMKAAKITHVVNLREDDETGFDAEQECSSLSETGISYCRVALGRNPTNDDFDLFRMVRKDMPRNARVLIHCSNGNRAAAVTCTWMVLDAKMESEEAIVVAKQAGMVRPETEKALRRYLAQAKA